MPIAKKEKLIGIFPSNSKTKKYAAKVQEKDGSERKIHFGTKGYKQYRDSTILKKYSDFDHEDAEKRRRYFQRHSGVATKRKAIDLEWKKSNGKYTEKILNHQYLW